jgi:hypothetical protein
VLGEGRGLGRGFHTQPFPGAFFQCRCLNFLY